MPTMPAFTRWQYPFNGYNGALAKLKRKMDQNATSTYPMIARITDSKGQVLSEAKYKNVWDRNPQFTSLVTEDWEAPIRIEFVDKHDEMLSFDELETVKCQPAEVQLGINWEDLGGDGIE